MTILLIGGGKSGKTALAQDLTLKLSRGKHYYLATMIPTDDEDRRRIRLHIEDRAGMGFETIECGHSLSGVTEHGDPEGVFLLDSVTALLMNVLFPKERNYEPDHQGADRLTRELLDFTSRVRHCVIVSDYIFADPKTFDPSTECYRRYLGEITGALARRADTVVEVLASNPIIHKGVLPE